MEAVAPRLQDDDRVYEVCLGALEWADERDYAGWDPYDGLNSRYLDALAHNWLTRLVGTHLVHKFPVNLRPLIDVPEERNPKGIALFAMCYLNLYEIHGDEGFLRKAERLLEWLDDNRSPDYDAPCWGYNFDWQNARKFFLPAYSPSIVVSTFCARAFFHHYAITGEDRSLAVAAGTAGFIRSDINTRRIRGYTAYTYTDSDSFVVINANALAASLFAQVGTELGDRGLIEEARDLVAFVEFAQDESGAWYYAMPREESHLSHDNFHTGFVLESLHTYLDVRGPDPSVEAAYESGMEFYREHLFEADGAPKFEHDKPYPRDAHSAGQAIRTLALDGREQYVGTARAVVDWSLRRLYDEEGFFYRRRGRILDDTTPYMRWSQAWMCYGLSTYLKKRHIIGV
jgi:hypothetical protein